MSFIFILITSTQGLGQSPDFFNPNGSRFSFRKEMKKTSSKSYGDIANDGNDDVVVAKGKH